VNLNRVCALAGLGGKPYRDGSYDYYVHTDIASNDPKGVGPFILASLEMEALNREEWSVVAAQTRRVCQA